VEKRKEVSQGAGQFVRGLVLVAGPLTGCFICWWSQRGIQGTLHREPQLKEHRRGRNQRKTGRFISVGRQGGATYPG